MHEIVIIILLILLNGIFAMSEIALVSARKTRLAEDSKKGNKGAKTALKLSENPDRFLSTVQIGITLIGILTGIYSGNKVALLLSEFLEKLGVSEYYSESVASVAVVAIVTYLTLVLGELLPKRIGMSAAERISKIMSRPMHYLSLIASPFVWLLSKSTTMLFKIMGIRDKDSKVTEAEIKSIIREGTEDGEVQPVEQDIMERVFLLGDLRINSIMTHVRDIVSIDTSMTAEEIREVVREDLYEMYPVKSDSAHGFEGVVTLKRLFVELDKSDFDLQKLIETPTYFYESMSVYKVLESMKTKGVSRGMVCDEFGECIGIVTLKDVMEGLVGAMNEESESDDIVKREGVDEWFVEGQCPIHELLQYFDCEDLYDPDENYSTLAGLCLEQFQYIPQVGESFEWNGFKIEVSDMDGVRIDKLLVTKHCKNNNEE